MAVFTRTACCACTSTLRSSGSSEGRLAPSCARAPAKQVLLPLSQGHLPGSASQEEEEKGFEGITATCLTLTFRQTLGKYTTKCLSIQCLKNKSIEFIWGREGERERTRAF